VSLLASLRRRPRRAALGGKLVLTSLWSLVAPLGNSCPHPIYLQFMARKTLETLAPSFATDFALSSCLPIKCKNNKQCQYIAIVTSAGTNN
uniref:Uncharacterized protein n=2 Tax=Oryctolagus cuniculus TaxID=9986 RepID=A0A5F9DM07_RABIT